MVDWLGCLGSWAEPEPALQGSVQTAGEHEHEQNVQIQNVWFMFEQCSVKNASADFQFY